MALIALQTLLVDFWRVLILQEASLNQICQILQEVPLMLHVMMFQLPQVPLLEDAILIMAYKVVLEDHFIS